MGPRRRWFGLRSHVSMPGSAFTEPGAVTSDRPTARPRWRRAGAARRTLARMSRHVAYIGLGSNLGDRGKHLADALAMMRDHPGIRLVRAGTVIETEPIGPGDQNQYLNTVAEVGTSLDPRALLETLLEIEKALGRVRRVKWGAREIDLDLLLYDDRVIDEPGRSCSNRSRRSRRRRAIRNPAARLANWPVIFAAREHDHRNAALNHGPTPGTDFYQKLKTSH